MQVGDDASASNIEDPKATSQLRKSKRVQQSRNTSLPAAVRRTKEPGALSSSSELPLHTTQKRAAPLNDQINGREEECEVDSHIETTASYNASSTDSRDLSGHVCLCQLEPKIPRPRNAFILYRQHHQHAIVARNPGLANPEISKIIGEQWKAENEDQKKVWQDLAQEEKARHHEQYPNYRYQPRRLGKPSPLPLNSSGQHTAVDKYRCRRCSGRSIKTPTSPFLSSGSTPTLPPLTSGDIAPTPCFMPSMSNLSLESPAHYRRRPNPSNFSNTQVPLTPSETAIYNPISPDLKRRRHNHSTSSNGRRVEDVHFSSTRCDSLHPISHQARQSSPNTVAMPPPCTPRKRSVDLNVLVPNQHDQSRSVEAMVMSVPYATKIKVLGRITPPLKDPGPTSPAIRVRGAILAVEGDDITAIKELVEWLKEFLAKDQEYSPRIAEPPKNPSDDQKEVIYEEYLDLVKEWHAKSREMIQFITTPVSSESNKDSQTPSRDTSIKPVVILPTYQLRASDTYTSRIPIQDAYSPTDHWQWMATLWRGTVGPDLTIYVQSSESKETPPKGKLVELNEEVRCLTVKKDKMSPFEEGALRRVGFEVSEWIRGIGSKSG
ncbi:uncharacterized protein BDR25DRAFT_241442 [Lindgomyces ingoldianus]|uniref:Uncharacterized protein n=1 Tax=Lindgomyces ingoldianus TaxID=673940 RepID=A0ACB6QDG7_9PLEO|nr:uncharacterized protein BDR25DRAFT_241442 [Lindgomyces ingoldianus]KAF2464942.1 hypothetical protein BDR25DRAFT_241442 [Lindgomyces ingoldianus]